MTRSQALRAVDCRPPGDTSGARVAGTLAELASGLESARLAALASAADRTVLDGIAACLNLAWRAVSEVSRPTGTARSGARAPWVPPLTARELDVLGHVAAGLSNPEIAAALCISTATVKTHVNHLLAKTACRDRAQLIVLAHGLGSASGPVGAVGRGSPR